MRYTPMRGMSIRCTFNAYEILVAMHVYEMHDFDMHESKLSKFSNLILEI
jgi:hypothetical protein